MVSLRLVIAGMMVLMLLAAGLALARRGGGQGQAGGERERCDKLFAAGNFKEAYDGYRRLALDPKTEPDRVGGDLTRAIECLGQLGRANEVDAFRDAVIAVHKDNWRLLQAAAESLFNDQHYGFIVAGAFQRGQHRGGGRHVGSYERDRARALQLLVQGLDRARTDPDRAAAGRYLLAFAQMLMGDRAQSDSWRLQALTPLDALPDYDDNPYRPWRQQQPGAPAEPDGTPVYYRVPEGLAKAKNDGERWRWALAQAAEADAGLLNTTRSTLATFLVGQFGTQTIRGEGVGEGPTDGPPGANGPYALDTLSDDETIARLATGIRRFKLPDEFNFIKIFQAIADEPKTGQGEESLAALASIFENRRQFDRSVEFLKRSIAAYGDKDRVKSQHIDQILGAWGEFEAMRTQPAGRGAAVDFRFRNGHRVHFEAHEILYDRLLKDVKDYLSSSPQPLDWGRMNIGDVGSRMVEAGRDRYLGKRVASWDLDLDPLPRHFDRRVTVTTPLQKAGAYFLTARMEGGNTARIVVWLDDTAIIKKPLAGKAYYFIADARTGQPVPRADVELFGWRQVQVDGRNEWRVETRSLALKTDDDGQLQVPIADLDGPGAPGHRSPYQWVVTARTPDGAAWRTRASRTSGAPAGWIPPTTW